MDIFSMQIRSAAHTDIGRVRRENEDRFLCDDVLQLYGVADGIGGLPGGAEAAQQAVTLLRDEIAMVNGDSMPDLAYVTHRVNESVAALGMRLSPQYGIGTTLTFGLVRDAFLHLAHVGDSRCYLLRSGRLSSLTTDHTVENDMRRRREAGEFVLFDISQGKSLTRCIGQGPELVVDTDRHELRPDDRVLFCSDGIDKVIDEPELAEYLSRGDDPDSILKEIVNEANDRGGSDNATGVMLIVKE